MTFNVEPTTYSFTSQPLHMVSHNNFEATHLYGRLFIPSLYQQKNHLDPEAYPERALKCWL